MIRKPPDKNFGEIFRQRFRFQIWEQFVPENIHHDLKVLHYNWTGLDWTITKELFTEKEKYDTKRAENICRSVGGIPAQRYQKWTVPAGKQDLTKFPDLSAIGKKSARYSRHRKKSTARYTDGTRNRRGCARSPSAISTGPQNQSNCGSTGRNSGFQNRKRSGNCGRARPYRFPNWKIMKSAAIISHCSESNRNSC